MLDPKVVADKAGSTGPLGPYRLTPPQPFLAPVPKSLTFGDVDWDGLHAKAMDHGLRLDDRLANSLEQHFQYSYNFFLPFLGHDGAISASNLATNYAFSNWLSAENPNAFDRFNLQFQQAYPDEKHIIIPLSSDTLDWVRMKIKGSKKDDYFFRFNLP